MVNPYYEEPGITIYNADCRDVLPQLDPVDLVLTDPPYKISQNYGNGVDADNLTSVSSILHSLPMIGKLLKNGHFAVVCYDNRILPFLFEAIRGSDLVYRKQLYIYRRWGIANRWVGWMQTTDPVCIFIKGHQKPFSPKIKGQVKHDFYIKSGPENETTGHPAQKPLEFFKDIIVWCSNQDEIILDPYLGSGTTLMAAKDLGRKAIGIEIEEKYCAIAVERLRQGVLI